MKRLIFYFIAAIMSLTSTQAMAQNEDIVYDVVEVMPEYPGGLGEMMQYFKKNIKYPKEAQQKKMEGRSLISFVVEKNGKISDVKVAKSSIKMFDDEAVRVVSSMPAWKPGKKNGKAVRVKFMVPIQFKM